MYSRFYKLLSMCIHVRMHTYLGDISVVTVRLKKVFTSRLQARTAAPKIALRFPCLLVRWSVHPHLLRTLLPCDLTSTSAIWTAALCSYYE